VTLALPAAGYASDINIGAEQRGSAQGFIEYCSYIY